MWGGFNYGFIYKEMIDHFLSGVFVEIGSWEGESAVFMAERIKESGKDIKFYTIDIFEPFYHSASKNIVHADYELFLKNIEPFMDYIISIKGDSYDTAQMFEDNSIDFLFIDGDHSYEGVKRDILTWLPKMKEEGIIAGHDYDWGFPGVVKAVDEIFVHKVIKSNSWMAIR